jgi:transposase
MIIHPGFAGIDISKHHLDVFDGKVGKPERFENTAAKARKLAKRFKSQGTFVVFEATGRYDRCLREAFVAEQMVFARVNPARARDFARATGQIAKTDAIDARLLATMAQTLSPETFRAAAPARQALADLQLRRDQLVSMRAEEMTRLEALGNAKIAKAIHRHIRQLSKDIASIETEIANLLAAEPDLKETAARLRSIPGIGPVATSVLIALMPELGRCTQNEATALAGLAPFNIDSGTMRGKRKIRGGRTRVRNALYMAAVVASRGKTKFADFYRHLTAKGKPAKLALTAVARKILITAHALIRDEKEFAV